MHFQHKFIVNTHTRNSLLNDEDEIRRRRRSSRSRTSVKGEGWFLYKTDVRCLNKSRLFFDKLISK